MGKTGMEAVKDKVPSLASLARQLNITRGAVAQWDRVPAERISDVARATDLPIHVLRPDLFSDPAEGKS